MSGHDVREMFRQSAGRFGERPAFRSGGLAVSYAELDRRSDHLAAALRSGGLAAGDRVAIVPGQPFDTVLGILGVLKAGGAFVPVDPRTPVKRLGAMLDLVSPAACLLGEEIDERLAGAGTGPAPRVLRLTQGRVGAPEVPEPVGPWPLVEMGQDDLCYVYFTSGSTGQPKGIAGRFRGIAHFIRWEIETFGVGPGWRVSQLTSPSFDAYLRDLFVPLCAGGTLCAPEDRETVTDGRRLAAWLEGEEIQLVHTVPSLFRTLLSADPPGSFPALRWVLLSGEPLLPSDVRRWIDLHGPEARLVNLYGPSETTMTKFVHLVEPADAERRAVPIGKPMPGARALVLDARGQVCPPRGVGEIYIRTPFRSLGYFGRPDLTREVFVPNPFGNDPEDLIYKTGDLGRVLEDGTFELLGRQDSQVKIRGVRIELAEIESLLLTDERVREVAVVDREDAAGTKFLCAYVVLSEPVPPSELHAFLKTLLLEHSIPSTFVRLETLPRTLSGKVDRRALPAPELRRSEPGAGSALPGSRIEEMVASLFARTLGADRVGLHENFFALGGHSLLATQLLSRIRLLLGAEVQLRQLFDAPTIAGLSRAVEAALRGRSTVPAPPLEPVFREGVALPLSFAQERLWFLHRMEPAGAAYNIALAVRFDGGLRPDALAFSLREIARRHEALRTTFADDRGRPVQVVSAEPRFPLELVDLAGLPPGRREAEAQAVLAAAARRPFCLEIGPLAGLTVLRLADDRHLGLLAMHHIVSDAWSIGVLVREIGALYRARLAGGKPDLPALPVQYADFAVWQRRWLSGEALESQLAYWRSRLGEAAEPLDLPCDRPRPAAPGGSGGRRRFQLEPPLAGALAAMAREREATLFMVLLAAFQALLYRYSGQSSFNVGTPVANRTRSELEPLIGFFANTLVLRGELSAELSFAGLLDRARRVTVEAQVHQDLPFEKLVGELRPGRDLSRTPLFQVVLVLQNAPLEKLELPGVTLSSVPVDTGTAKFDLVLALAEEGGALDAAFEYAADLFDAATVDRMAGHFRTLLTAASAAPDALVAELPLLTEAEARQLAQEQGEPRAWPQSLCLHEQLELQVARRPGAVAVSFEGRSWTYEELDREANRLARHLRRLGVGLETRVGLCLDRALEMVAGILGILKSGGAYVPLDPALPPERLAFLMADARVPVVVTRQAHLAVLGLAGSAAEVRAVCLDRDAAAIARQPQEPPHAGAEPANAAYVIYTSGSTGLPKGTVVTHANAGRLFAATEGWFGFGPGDVWTMFHSFAFDFSVWELWGALLYGGRLAVVPREVAQSSEAYAGLLRREGVTVVNQTPSAFRRLIPELAKGAGEVRLVILGGEAVDLPGLRPWFELFPGEEPRLINMYGITETTVHVTYRPLRPSDLSAPWQGSPIGVPLGDLRVHLLDGAGQPVPAGVPGEICVSGEGLARGYLDRPDLTAARFVPDRFGRHGGERLYRSGDLARRLRGGELEYLRRIDHQVKVRGFRIELEEIESALRRHPRVKEAVVVALAGREGDQRLVAYVSPAAVEEAPGRAELREHLQGLLPEYMIPATFVALPALPLTPNGKIDRRALPEPGTDRAEVETGFAPRSAAEEVLAGIWCEVLDLEMVAAGSDFFESGGHSLLGTQVTSRVREIFGVELPLRDLFEFPALGALARRIEAAQGKAERGGESVRIVPREGELPLSWAQQRLWFLDHLEPGSAAYNIPLALRLRGELRLDLLRRALSEVARRHEVLRTTFASRDGRSWQVIAPPGEVPLPVIDLSALPGPGREREAGRLAAEEAGRPFSLAHGPLLRIRLARLAAADGLLLVTLHHIVSDGWSLPIFVRETAALYEAFAVGQPSPLPDLPFQYADYAAWQRQWLRGPALVAALSFWSARLRGLPAVLDLPTDRPRPAVRTWRGARVGGVLDEELSLRVLRLGRREGATPFMVLLAAFGALLHRYGGQESFAVGTPVAGRNRLELEPLIGLFVNTLVLRCDLSGGSTFREVLARLRETVLEADVHQELPFEKLVEELAPERTLSHTPLFQVMLAFLNVPWREIVVEGLTVEPMGEGNVAAKFDLTLAGRLDGARLRLDLEYAAELFDEATAARILRHLERLLAGAVADAALRVSELPLFDDAERNQVLAAWKGVGEPERLGRPVHELIAGQAGRTPDAVAVEHLGRSVSYRDLWRRAAAIARRLRSRGAGPDVPVALFLERSPDLVAGALGILAAGGAFLPFDPTLPVERLTYLLDDSRAPVVLTRRSLLSALPPGVAAAAVLVDDIPEEAARPEPAAVDLDSLAYVIYTSGSTGGPKGVMISHRGLLHYLGWSLRAYVEPGRRGAVLATSLSFDLAVTSLFTPLLAGQTVVLLPEGEGPEALVEGLRSERGLSFLKLTPAHLEVLNRGLLDLPVDDKAALLVLGGEALSGESLAPWRERSPSIRVVNEYGPTEAVVGCCVYEVPPGAVAAGPVPIGKPLPGTRLYVLDRWGSPAPAGVPGELHVGGEGLARGYLSQPALTAGRFVPDPFSGEPGARLYRTGDLVRLRPGGDLEFLGRIDHQVKVRGYRIEPAEIAAALLAHADVREAVVLAREDDLGDRRLVAYLVMAPGRTVAVGGLRDFLQRRLPAYMVPASFVELAALPLTANGKVDLRALAAPGTERPDLEEVFVAPSSPAERQLAAIWSEVLRIERVGVHDNFFQLGGDSILSLQIVSRANRAGLQISTRQIFEQQTVAGLAAVASFAPVTEAEQEPVAGAPPLTPIQRWFFEQEMPEPEHYNQAVLLELGREIALDLLRRAVARLLEHHDALRLRFERAGGGWRQTFAAPGGEPPVCCLDLSALPAGRWTAERIAAASALQGSLDLAAGPLLRVALFRSGTGSPDRLLLVIHHLAVDGVSWRILLEDFQDLCRRLPEGGPCELPAKTTSYKRWAERLREHVLSGAVDHELAYWTDEARRRVAPLPGDASGAATAATVDLVPAELTFEETEALLHETPRAYRTQINDLLLAALARAFHGWTGERTLLIDLEGHGREEILEGIDLSRTVGWFTSIFPLLIRLEDPEDPGALLTSVKEQLRRVPDRGIGYGLLRYLTAAGERLGTLPQAEVSFNYLGQLDAALAEGWLRPAAEPVGALRSPRQPRRHAIEVVGRILDGRLRVEFLYSRGLHERATIERLARGFLEALRALIEHCRSPWAGGVTPSDFPLVELNQEQLALAIRQIGQAKV